TLPPAATVCRTKSSARANNGTVCDRSMMCTPLRSPKIYGFILGFQRWVWWPKCAPASSNCCMVTSVDAMVFLLPVMPLQGRESRSQDQIWPDHRYDGPACGMSAQIEAAAPEIKQVA